MKNRRPTGIMVCRHERVLVEQGLLRISNSTVAGARQFCSAVVNDFSFEHECVSSGPGLRGATAYKPHHNDETSGSLQCMAYSSSRKLSHLLLQAHTAVCRLPPAAQ